MSARHGTGRVAKAVLIGAVPPVMVKSDSNPGGLPIEVFDGFRAAARRQPRAVLPRHRRAARSTASTAPGAKVSQGIIDNWWRQGMMGGAKAHYDCIKAFSETDFTEDLKTIDVPVLVMHGDDDQIVPIADSALLSVKLLQAAARSRSTRDCRTACARPTRTSSMRTCSPSSAVDDAGKRRQTQPARADLPARRPQPAVQPITALTSRYSSRPKRPHSRPLPDCL